MGNRLDQMVAKMLEVSRTKAQSFIKEGCVCVDGKVCNKPSFEVDNDLNITILKHDNFVSRGAYKLIKGLDEFGVNVVKKRVLDMGASTGGFTQVLLQRGADRVYSVDVGKGELDPSLANNSQVVNMEGRDIRTLTRAEVGDCKLVVGDLSFISLKKILPHLNSILGKIEMLLLFKPQFECGKEVAKKFKGIIKDRAIHKKLLKEFKEEIEYLGFTLSNLTYSPIKGGSGNIEYLLHINGMHQHSLDIEKIVDLAFLSL